MKYLNNKDLLKQIHISKMSYSWYLNKDYYYYDVIVDDLENIPIELREQADKKCLERLQLENTEENKKSIQDKIIYRLNTYDHIPTDLTVCRVPPATSRSQSQHGQHSSHCGWHTLV